VLACVLRIISTCFMRPGSEVYASEHGSYGIATLRRKHIK
jgi:DNA topoisomerase-1